MSGCLANVPVERLLAYERGEGDAAGDEAFEEHLFTCDACSRRSLALAWLGRGIRSLIEAGAVSVNGTPELLEEARRRGLRIREYRLAPGDTVQCTASPDDDFVAMRFVLDIDPPESVSVVWDLEAGGEHTTRVTEDVWFDPRSREVVFLDPAAMVRTLPRSRGLVQARVRTHGAEQLIGPFHLDHTPWDELPPERRELG